MSRVLAQLHWDCGRMGDVEGLFVTTVDELEKAYGREIYFGEILGKHSEICGPLERDEITIKSDDQEFIDKLVSIIGSERISGYCPLDYFQDEEEDDDYDEDEDEDEE